MRDHQDSERTVLSPEGGASAGMEPEDEDRASLRRRMEQAGWLLALGGMVAFVGFLLVAIGFAEGIPFASTFGLGTASLSPLVPWGIAFIGLGVMLGLFGAAIKGPSVEWRDISPELQEPREGLRPTGTRLACPGCGGDVYSTQSVCPECGHRLRGPAP